MSKIIKHTPSKLNALPCMIAHAYNPSYLRDRVPVGHVLRPTRAKVSETHFNK
jgi:hypothetical protein